jgi:prephenate dehydrogenase
MGRILSADSDLYSEIQAYNLQGPALIQAYCEAAQTLGHALTTGHVEAFKESMTASATALGPTYLAEMLQKSKTLQRHLV